MANSKNTTPNNLSEAISYTMFDLYRMESLFNAIHIISNELNDGGLDQDGIFKAVESISAISSHGVEYCSKTSQRLDKATMKRD